MDLWALSDLETPWCVHVAGTLRVAEHIEAGQSGIEELAASAGADPDALLRLLRHLVSKGVFEEPHPGRFALNNTARQFLNPGMRLVVNLDGFGGRMAHAWGTLLAAVRTGRCAYHERFGVPYWDDLAAHPEIAAEFDALMGPEGHGTPDPDVLLDDSDWNAVKTVVDVGGGTGTLLTEIVRKRPHVRATLVDLPQTVARANGPFDKSGQSFFDPLPAGADVYLLSKVLGDWPDAEARAILCRCAEAARPGGRVVVLTHAKPGQPAGPELLMLILVGGRDRSFEQLCALATSAGLAFHGAGRVSVEFRPV